MRRWLPASVCKCANESAMNLNNLGFHIWRGISIHWLFTTSLGIGPYFYVPCQLLVSLLCRTHTAVITVHWLFWCPGSQENPHLLTPPRTCYYWYYENCLTLNHYIQQCAILVRSVIPFSGNDSWQRASWCTGARGASSCLSARGFRQVFAVVSPELKTEHD